MKHTNTQCPVLLMEVFLSFKSKKPEKLNVGRLRPNELVIIALEFPSWFCQLIMFQVIIKISWSCCEIYLVTKQEKEQGLYLHNLSWS